MRVYNFSAGPAVLPEEVLKKAASELLTYGNSGQSVMEMSHRSKEYEAVHNECIDLLREVMAIPANYKILFIQGGAHMQFEMVPLNLMQKGTADFVVTGQWAGKAFSEAKKYGEANLIASSKDKTFSYIPELDSSTFNKNADYFHICENNTIFGTKFWKLPETGSVPLVSDMSSCILSEPVDVSKYGLIYACAQKNMGPSGVTIVIIREDLIRDLSETKTPTMLQYKIYDDNNSLYNTPPTYSIYMCKLVLEWIKEKGGLSAMKTHNEKKAAILYDAIDSSKIFSNPVVKKDRSLMNVTFVTGNEELDKKFIAGAKAAGLVNLGGHRSVGGMRASIYNAMPAEGVQALVDFMKKFEENATLQ
ncbi:MAG: 3-phosphoserine/phosphohydroxythreonine transaminase [Oscillospiraceae bacterium]|jgi:phosphoserine aminotransferase|nr:3-phosphoserine/phosphohydroxythreonine transaminase [Oscillospiraceae bacterium]